jgi:hypothetical protein
MPPRITEEKARELLTQTGWLLLMCIASFAVLFALFFILRPDGRFAAAIAISFLAYGLACLLYYIWLGRLAYGLQRSVIYYVGGTWLFAMAIHLIAHFVAYRNIRAAVISTYTSSSAFRADL